jgi:acylphosphatase
VHGRVQGVGFRAWTEGEAMSRDLSGWVRNRRDGTVEAVLRGEAEAVDEMLALLRRGPRSAYVSGIEVEGFVEAVGPDFKVLPTA